MLDVSPCYYKTVKQPSAENSLTTLDQPRNSPDLNPIENQWKIIKSKVGDKQHLSAVALNQVIKEVRIEEIFKVIVRS